MADLDYTKMGIAAIAAGSLGGFGGHTIGSNSPDISTSLLEQCRPIIEHTVKHEKLDCDIKKLTLKVEKSK